MIEPVDSSRSADVTRLKNKVKPDKTHFFTDEHDQQQLIFQNNENSFFSEKGVGAVIFELNGQKIFMKKKFGAYTIESVYGLSELPFNKDITSKLPEDFVKFLTKTEKASQPGQFNAITKMNGHTAEMADLYAIPLGNSKVLINLRNLSSVREMLDSMEDSKKSLKDLQDNVPIGLFQVSKNGYLTYANNWFIKILGYSSANELSKVPVSQLFADELAVQLFNEKIGENGRIKDIEIQLIRKQGDTIWTMVSASKISSKSNRVINYDGYIYDITERKLALEKLRDSEEMFRVISQNVKSVLYVYNQDERFIFVNPMIKEITGYSREEILKMKFYDIIHPDFKEIVKQRGLKRIDGKKIQKSYEFKILTKSGEEKWIEIFATRMQLKGETVVLGLANDVTDRQNSLEAIKQSEEKYKSLYSFFRLMVDNVPDMIWAKDLQKRYIFANKSLCDNLLMAKNTDEPVGKTNLYFAEKERNKKNGATEWYTFGESGEDSDELVMNQKKSLQFDEYGNIKGKFLYLDVQKSPLWDNRGKMIGTVGSARDVTTTKQLERERKIEEKLKNVVYRIGNAVNSTKDLSEFFTVIRLEISEIIDTTNLYIALYNKEKEEISLPYFIDEKDRFKAFPARKTLTHYLIKNSRPMLLREHDYKKLANEGEIELTGSLAKVWLGVPLMVKGETIGAMVVQNYTDAYAFDEEDLELLKFLSFQVSTSINQKIADDSLRESEFTLRQIIDNVPVMIFAKDKYLKFILANKAMADMYGLPVDEIEGRLQSDIHPDKEELEKYMEDDYAVIDQGEIKFIKEERFTDKNGEVRILQTTKIPLRTGQDKGIALLGVAVDITDRIGTEVELKKAKVKAEESDKLKTAFLANMSHEIRTPMNAIIGFSELLNDPELSTNDRKEFIKLIGENSKMLLKLIEDIIDVAKIEAEQIKIVNTHCHANQIIDELAYYYSNHLSRFENKQIDLIVKKASDEGDFCFITDPLRFKQILNNLLGNAIKFTEKGKVEIGYYFESDDQIIFYVRDTGIGLASSKMKLIFERFRQVEESSTKEYGGTGLGLTISRRLVELLGGSIWVESVLYEGSTFFFSLPFKKVQSSSKPDPVLGISGNRNWKGKTILVAEDESSNFELIHATLQNTKVKVLRARNGREAVLEFMENSSIDLILMDIRMPEMDGYEATKRIKKINSKIPVISLTAFAMAEDREKSFQAGCNEYISKPFNPADLLNKIDKYMV